MNEKEKTEFYIAMCRCCLIAEAMKGCAACRFNFGLVERGKRVDSIPLSISAKQREPSVTLLDPGQVLSTPEQNTIETFSI